MTVKVKAEPVIHDHYEEPAIEIYTFGTFAKDCDNTGKSKELIKVYCEYQPMGGAPMSPHDMREPSIGDSYTVETGFAKNLGYNWELWMALRELYSNMLDEGGHIQEGTIDDIEIDGTCITLEFEAESAFAEIWKQRHIYINESEPLHEIAYNLEILKNDENYLRIYKQNILVYSDQKVPSRYAYNIKFGEIDERRILRDFYSISSEIAYKLLSTKNEAFLREIITKDFQLQPDEFLSSYTSYGSASELMNDIAFEVYEEHGDVKSYSWIIDSIKKRKDCKIGGKIIRTLEDHVYTSSQRVTVDSRPEEVVSMPADESPAEEAAETPENEFLVAVRAAYDFHIECDVKKAKLSGSKVVADKFAKCLIIADDFDIVEDFPEFIVQYIDLTQKGNIIKNLSVFICNLIKK